MYFNMTKLENIRYKLREKDYYFLKNIQMYIDNELYFYGSVARYDYFPEKSDIDIIIITENVDSTIKQLQNHLNISKDAIERIVNHMDNKSMSYAYKINYSNLDNDLALEIFIYDEKYREMIINDIEKKNNLPIYIVIVLCILKVLSYYLRIIPDDAYKYIKNSINNLYLYNTTQKHMINMKI